VSEADHRPDPDALLANLHKEARQQQCGRLKVFLGMCAGVGKTYAMLEAGQKARREGVDVAIAYIETHGRTETDALVRGIPVVPRNVIVHRGMTLTEMNLDAVLVRHPRLALVDELAHTNAPGSRHPKRHQDVAELLQAGIDVYTTLNVQHLESRCETVREVTGVSIQETVPDTVLDGADIELVDLSPEDLLQRLAEGRVYVPDRAAVARQHFFREGNLTALREIALRLAAERVGQDVRDFMQARQIAGPWKTGHRLLVAVSPSPFSESLVRWTRRLADGLGCSWIAAYVETSQPLSADEQTRLTHHLSLARELGAEIRTTADEDVVRGLLRIARAQNVTQFVVGKPLAPGPWGALRRAWLLQRLVRESGNIDVHVVRAGDDSVGAQRTPTWRIPTASEWLQYLLALAVVFAVTILNRALANWVGPHSAGMLFLIAVIVLAMFLGRGPIYLASAASALVWDYFFLPPRYTFQIKSVDDAILFGMYFVVALGMGQLIGRARARERMDRRREERAAAMYLLTLELGDASAWQDIARVVESHVERVFQAEGTILLPGPDGTLTGDPADKEFGAACWAFDHGKLAGRFSDTLPLCEAMYLPLRTTGGVLGVLRMRWRQESPPTLDQRTLLESFQRHIALVVDRQRLHDSETSNRVLAESERLSQALLRSVSHELRTPIAAIQSAAGELSVGGDAVLQATLVSEIREAGDRLNRLVGNLLDMTRLESGRVELRPDWCDIGDVVRAALRRVDKELAGRTVDLRLPSGLQLVKIDFRLMEQALANLLHNAAVHTAQGTPVEVRVDAADNHLTIAIADRGPGLPPEALPRLFDKFYRAPGAKAGGTGLGLSIVKGFVEAHNGRVEADNRPGGGAVFTISLPLTEPPSVERT
jgi:two-component system sensor histidine kinase KdpD